MEYKININLEFFSILGIVFIVLKLLNVITWSWLWVLSPLWISILGFFLICIIVGIIVGIRNLK